VPLPGTAGSRRPGAGDRAAPGHRRDRRCLDRLGRRPRRRPAAGRRPQLRPAPRRAHREQVQGYYHGFANRTLWPLFHDLVVEPVIDRRWWRAYQDVNRRFAEALAEVVEPTPRSAPLVWVQDYHLMLLPELLRRLARLPDRVLPAHPVPAAGAVARLPWRDQLLTGCSPPTRSGSTPPLPRQLRPLGPAAVPRRDRARRHPRLPDGRQVRPSPTRSRSTPTSSPSSRLPETEPSSPTCASSSRAGRCSSASTGSTTPRASATGCSRSSCCSTPTPDLRASSPSSRSPSRAATTSRSTATCATQVETEVGRINGRFTEPGTTSRCTTSTGACPREALAAYYRLADVMCVTPLKDGMNLVAKEFVTVQAAATGRRAAAERVLRHRARVRRRRGALQPVRRRGQSYLMESALELDPMADRREPRLGGSWPRPCARRDV
jgi:trehalose 6-phosphate synthase